MDQDAIDYLINRGYCICGTRLDAGTSPHQNVLAERKKLPPEHIGSVVMNYKNKAEGYLSGNENYCETISAKYKEIRRIQRELGDLLDEQEKLNGLILDDTDAKAIETKRKEAHTHYIEAQSDLNQVITNIARCDTNIRNCEGVLGLPCSLR
ncbi:MAG: hypothetical protein ACI4LP_06705 [Anaerovoracaceae bacterium]